MGAEIKQTLERNYDLVLNAQEIRSLTFGKLKELGAGGGDTSATTNGAVTSEDKQVSFASNELMPEKVLLRLTSKDDKSDKKPLFLVSKL